MSMVQHVDAPSQKQEPVLLYLQLLYPSTYVPGILWQQEKSLQSSANDRMQSFMKKNHAAVSHQSTQRQKQAHAI